jgi:opacity protein-like surface antigen
MRLRKSAVLLLPLALAAAPRAQAGDFGLALEGGYFKVNFKQTAAAVFESSGGPTFGGELRYQFDEHFYVAAGARRFSKDGSRVFVASATSPVNRLRDQPLSAKMTPVYATVGYRLRQFGLLAPYVGLGAGVVSYKEESSVAGITSTFDASKPSWHALLGVEVGNGLVRLGAEAVYASVPNTIGTCAGTLNPNQCVSKIYDETDVGGFSFIGKIVITTARAKR